MKLIAAILVDLETSPLGTRSRLRDDLLGQPVLRRTVERVLAAGRPASVHVLARVDQSREVEKLLHGLPVRFETHVGTQTPYAGLVQAGRWWGLDGWRGGVGGLCAFDEDVHVALLTALATREAADAVVSVPAAAAVVDPAIIDGMIQHYEDRAGAMRITIVQAPPGLGAVVLGRALLDELLPTSQTPGVLLTYHPDQPSADLTGKEACYRPSAEVIEARGRLICDTRRSFERVRDLLAAGGDRWDPAAVGGWLSRRLVEHVDETPEEIEIELTTDDPLPSGDGGSSTTHPTPTRLRPHGDEVGRRGPISLKAVRRVAEAIGEYDDVRIVLGGFGEPCLHPELAAICRILREAGAAAIAVRTGAAMGYLGDSAPGGGTKEEAVVDTAERVLFDAPVDVIEVTLDAATPETFRRVQGVDAFEYVSARLERWINRRAARQQVRPLIVPSMVKANETFDDLEPFFDGWQRRLGAALVTGYSHCARQRPDRAVTGTAPPQRGVCRRVFSRLLVLADGRVTTCDQDFRGVQTIGDLADHSLRDLWRHDRLAAIRGDRLDGLPLCPKCEEWHRP
jgi:hypothetical protein